MAYECDVAVVGGGPAAATLGTLLRKYNPSMKVAIFEREKFPRDHVGESLIPHLTPVLLEMDVWDKVEAANFPIKIGARFKWGETDDLWLLDFLPSQEFKNVPRPSKYEGQRVKTAFQVDRSIYDKILLDHAKESGCHVFEGVKVGAIRRDGDRVTGLELVPGSPGAERQLGGETEVLARYYVDASGNSGILRRTMGVEVDSPTALRNIAVYDYWQNAEWAEHIGVGGTRILVLSLDCGWLWFIPLGPTRTSLGLVVPAEYVKRTGKKPEELYVEAVASEPTISKLVANATRENITQTTKDWSFVAERLWGENWFLSGDAAGFADPILSAGLTLAQVGARNLAYTILELERGNHDPEWLKYCYGELQSGRIRNHIRFADFWYSANAHFKDLKEYCAEIALSSGVSLEADEAWVWMATGGFANDDLGLAGVGTYTVGSVKKNIRRLTGKAPKWELAKYNKFRLNLAGTIQEDLAAYSQGKIARVKCFRRGSLILANYRSYGAMFTALQAESELDRILDRYVLESRKHGLVTDYAATLSAGIETLEAMAGEGWVDGRTNPNGRFLGFAIDAEEGQYRVGWISEGVGLTSLDPAANGEVVVAWDEWQAVQAANG